MRLVQLDAMLSMTYAGAGKAFRGMSDDLQDAFMWSCSTLAAECLEMFNCMLDKQAERPAAESV